jgi:hypothetical protein
MATLRAFIADRRAEINRQIALLRAELLDLDKVEAALSDQPVAQNMANRRPTTFKGMAIHVLKKHSAAGLDANQLRLSMERTFDLKIERSSLSPQLSRLKREGILTLDGKLWRRIGALDKEAAYLPPKENEPLEINSSGSETRPLDGSDPSDEHVNQSPKDILS